MTFDIKKVIKDNNLVMWTTWYDCGPCSLLNFLIEYTDRFTCEDLLCKCNSKPNTWTENNDLESVIKNIDEITSYKIENWSIEDIEKAIWDWYKVIVNYFSRFYNVWHFALVVDTCNKHLYLKDSAHWFVTLPKKTFESYCHDSQWKIKWWMIAVKWIK